MGAVESDSVKSARKAKDKLHKACERASETRERTFHRQEQNRMHMATTRVTRQWSISSQHTSTITCTYSCEMISYEMLIGLNKWIHNTLRPLQVFYCLYGHYQEIETCKLSNPTAIFSTTFFVKNQPASTCIAGTRRIKVQPTAIAKASRRYSKGKSICILRKVP